LVVDASVLVGELLRAAGRRRLGDDRLELFLAEETGAEVRVELPRRIVRFARSRNLSQAEAEELTRVCVEAIEANLVTIDEAVYAAAEDEARARSVRDPDDWPLVACALVLDAAIWTNDDDLLGTGVATWTAATLQSWLDRHPA
jgi:predicted nucleic acid-binding protein